jgi:hypothetical protein
MKDKVLNWMGTGRVGASSKAMALHMTGAPCDGSYPHDPDDLNRCLLFLEAVPEAREHLPRMATLNKVWAALVGRWDEIEASFLGEVGRDWCDAHSAPKTYKLMREVIDTANKILTNSEANAQGHFRDRSAAEGA